MADFFRRAAPASERILEKIGEGLDMPMQAVSGLAHIEACGNREIMVDGCKGVLEYNDCCVRLNTGRLIVRISGCSLTITMLRNGQAVICGDITGVDFSS